MHRPLYGVMTPLQFTRSVRSLNRLRHIAHVLTQHGFGYIVAQLNLARFVPVWMLRRKSVAPAVLEAGAANVGQRLTQVCIELGPTFIKLGQMMTTRSDIVPPSVLKELRSLQDDVPPFEGSVAMDIIAEELARPLSECFAAVDKTPIASGSIGQVHRARGLDDTELVIKVRRPGIDTVIELDMQLLKWLAESLESLVPELQVYRPTLLVNELEQMLTRELDYVNEASMTARFAEAFEDDHSLRVPRVYWDLCGPRVLTLEALGGTNIETLLSRPSAAEAPIDRPLVARRLADAYLKQVFELGFFHADPHPGNILVEPTARVGLIDFGQVGTISDELLLQLVVMVYASVHREVSVVVDALADLGALGPNTDRRSLERALQALLDKYYGLPLKRLDIGTLVTEFSDVVRRHDVVVPREALMLFKALGMVGTVTRQLDPDLDMLELLKPRLLRTMRKRLSPPGLAREFSIWGWHLLSVIRQAPMQLREGLRRVASGTFQLQLRHQNIDRLTNELDRSSNRLAFSIVIAAIIVGSSVVVSADTALTVFDIKVQHLGIVGYVMAGVLGLALSWAIFRSGRLH